MRQNLTNVKEIDIKDVEHFYVVGSTTKEGLLEGKSNVKLDLKKAVSEGGTSGEDAERMYEALFGQMPYLFIPGKSAVTLLEAVTSDVFESFDGEVLYKKKEPFPAKGLVINYNARDNSWRISFYENTGIPIELPEEEFPGGPWYIFLPADVDLSKFPAPVVDGDPVPLTGIELPIQPTLKTFNMEAGLQEYTKITEDTTFYKCIIQEGGTRTKYTIKEVEGVWMWKAEGMIS